MKLGVESSRVRIAVMAAGVAVAIGGAGVVSAAPAAACSGVGYHLSNETIRNRPSLTIKFASQETKNYTQFYLQQAINEIRRATGGRTVIRIGGIVGTTQSANEIVVTSKPSNRGNCFGVANWMGCGGFGISKNNVVSNGWINFQLRLYKQSGKYQRAIMAHELGHAVGLRHTSDRNQLMNETVNANDVTADNRTYKSGDIKGLNRLARDNPRR